MREPSTLCALLDDRAALGDVAGLRALAERWRARADRTRQRDMPDAIAGIRRDGRAIWMHAAVAADYRATGVELRLAGAIQRATLNEDSSEFGLKIIANYGRREAPSSSEYTSSAIHERFGD